MLENCVFTCLFTLLSVFFRIFALTMAGSNFIDYVKILCRSGKGGEGSCHFHRAKYVPKGGPDAGNRGA